MKRFFATTLAVLAAACTTTNTQAPGAADAASESRCAIGYVTGIGGSVQSLRQYLATPGLDKYRFLADNPIQCKVSDDGGRASNCVGLTSFRRERVSVYENIDDTLEAVVARVDLDHDAYPAIVAVRKQDVRCAQ